MARRYEEEGFEGLNDRSSIQHHQSTEMDPEMAQKILSPRQQYQFGWHKISMYLSPYLDITVNLDLSSGS